MNTMAVKNANQLHIARKEDDPKEALVEFQSVIDTEEEKGDWYCKDARDNEIKSVNTD